MVKFSKKVTSPSKRIVVKNRSRKFDFVEDDGRQNIENWRCERNKKEEGVRLFFQKLRIYNVDFKVIKSFVQNINLIILLQMALAGLLTFICESKGIKFDIQSTLFVSPLVFPITFLINADFQRREKVLDDLASLKSNIILTYLLLREWRESAELNYEFLQGSINKFKQLVHHIREYLLTTKDVRRQYIAMIVYEDISDISQILDQIRTSNLNGSPPLVGRITAFLYGICLAFERLRVVREYRSPRSIRSFAKVLIFLLPILLSPLYVKMGESLTNNSSWASYYIAILVSFVFGSLQGVQDTLDDPFDGMTEDDINLDLIDTWVNQSFDHTVKRIFNIGRFQVTSTKEDVDNQENSVDVDQDNYKKLEEHPFANILNTLPSDATIKFQSMNVQPNINIMKPIVESNLYQVPFKSVELPNPMINEVEICVGTDRSTLSRNLTSECVNLLPSPPGKRFKNTKRNSSVL